MQIRTLHRFGPVRGSSDVAHINPQSRQYMLLPTE